MTTHYRKKANTNCSFFYIVTYEDDELFSMEMEVKVPLCQTQILKLWLNYNIKKLTHNSRI